MTTDIDHAMRARDALADQARRWITDYLDRRRSRWHKLTPDVAQTYLIMAKQAGRSHLHFKQLVQSEIARLMGKPS